MLESGKAIDIEFSGDSIEELQVVAAKTKQRLREYPGVIDITDSFRGGKAGDQARRHLARRVSGTFAARSGPASAAGLLWRRGAAHPTRP